MENKIYYKGKGEHSVRELELIIEQREEELHLIRSGQSDVSPPVSNTEELRDKTFQDWINEDESLKESFKWMSLHTQRFMHKVFLSRQKSLPVTGDKDPTFLELITDNAKLKLELEKIRIENSIWCTGDKDGWVSVEDRLPENKELVLCFCNFGDHTMINVARWNHFYKSNQITHWMPLPNSPK